MKKSISFLMSCMLLTLIGSSQQAERLTLRAENEAVVSGTVPLPFTLRPQTPARRVVSSVLQARGTSTTLATGTDVQVNNNNGAMTNQRFTQSGTTIAVNGNNIVVAFDDAGSYNGSNNHFTGFAYSTDGGVTFTDGGTLPASAQGDAGFPSVAKNLTTGRTYLLTLVFSGTGLSLFRSDDNGVTWMPPVNAEPGGGNEDKPWMTVDNYPGAGNGNVYVVSRRFSGTPGIYLFRSVDHGNTFTPGGGVQISNTDQGPFVVVAPDHSVYVFWLAFTTNEIKMRRSTDQGVTFGPPVTVASGQGGGINGDLALTGIRQGLATPASFRTNGFPQVVVNPVSGHLYVTYANNPAGTDKGDISFVMSSDGGLTWTPPLRVNDDATTTDQWKPTIAVLPTGNALGIFYHSRQEDPGNNMFRYYGRIADISGPVVTFGTSFPVSDVASFPEFGRDAVVNSVYMGDYDQSFGVAGGFHVVWSDSRDDLAGGAPRKDPNVYHDFVTVGAPVETDFYSKSTGDLHNLTTWGTNPDGSGASPSDFGDGKIFNLVNRGSVYTMTGNWTVEGAIRHPVGTELQINGFTLTLAKLYDAGNITGSPTSNLTVSNLNSGGQTLFFTPGAAQLNNFTIIRGGLNTWDMVFVYSSDLEVYNILNVQSGPLAFSPGFKLILKSSALNTARVAPVGIGGSIDFNATVERYIPARRAWRILSAPVKNTGQTINQAWQEGTTNVSPVPNPFPGFGTHITGGPVFGSVANGFDQNPGAASSLKFYNSATDTWNAQPNTNITPVGSKAWMIFIRGDRGIPLSHSSVPPVPTTLRATGPLNKGDQNFVVNPTGFTAIGNPYASPVDFATITKTNVQNSMWLWDPKMGGANGVGAYVNVSFNGTGWDVTPASVSPESQIIQNGQGFLVKTINSAMPGSLVIKESDKSATPNMDVFRTARNSAALRINLQVVNENQTTSVLDEVFTSQSNYFSQKLDEMDALKLENIEENIAIVSGTEELMVERRPFMKKEDGINLKLWNLAERKYMLEFRPERLADSLNAWILDRYLQTVTKVPLNQASQITFSVTADKGSANPDRFSVVFSAKKPQPEKLIENFITVYPNPLVGNRLTLQFVNVEKGNYQVRFINKLGQVVFTSIITHAGGTLHQQMQLDKKLLKGIYQVQVTGKDVKSTVKLLVD